MHVQKSIIVVSQKAQQNIQPMHYVVGRTILSTAARAPSPTDSIAALHLLLTKEEGDHRLRSSENSLPLKQRVESLRYLFEIVLVVCFGP